MEARSVSEEFLSLSDRPPPLARWLPRLRVGLPLGLALLLAGCGGTSSPTPPVATQPPPTWIEKDIEHQGMTISLGYCGQDPVAAISRNGQPVADAMVFCTALAADGQPLGAESATVYEPAEGKTPALYSAGKMTLPEANSLGKVRFRIVLPDVEQDWTRDVEIAVK